MKWRLRSCPRCGGDMFIYKGLYGWFEKCLQCGYGCELRELDEFGQNPALKDRSPLGSPRYKPKAGEKGERNDCRF